MTAQSPQPREGRVSNPFVVSDELNEAAWVRVLSILPALAFAYLLFAGMALVVGPPAARVAAVLAGASITGVWIAMRRRVLPVCCIHRAAGLVCALVLAHSLASLDVSGAASATILFLLIVVTGATLHSLAWQTLIVGISCSMWIAAAWPVLHLRQRWYWLLVLLTTAALSGVAVKYRMWKVKKTADGATPDDQFQRHYLTRAVEGTQDGLWYWELKTDVFHFSSTWAGLLGYEPWEIARNPNEWLDRVHPGYIARLRAELTAHLYGEVSQFRNEHRMRRKDGTYVWVLARGTVVRNAAGEPLVLAGSHSDITPMIEVEKRILTDAFNDELTGLPNRNFLQSHLELAVEDRRGRGHAAPLFAVMFLDLDRFKFINDTMGHQVGDELLIAVAGRLRNCARPGDVVSRFGGDEFVVLLRNLRDQEEAVQVGNRMLRALLTPFQLGDREIQSGGSIGIAMSSERFTRTDEILHFGDVAMYQAKKAGKGNVKVFQGSMLDESNRQEELKRELERALERRELVLHYQPFFHTASGRITGAEALIRWRRPSGELLYPGDFLPLAEKSGLMREIGDWALRTACAQNSAWQRAGIGPVRISVNISAPQLQERNFPQTVMQILAETGLRPEWLELELTEAALMRNTEQSAGTLKVLGDSGIRTAIDNFGTGFASINNLRQFPIRTLKMDRAFISEVTTDVKAAAAARGLITMAHHMGLAVVAEGVEQSDQLRFLANEQCDQAQGFLMGRPVPGEELAAMLRAQASMEAASASVTDISSLHALHSTASTPVARAHRAAG